MKISTSELCQRLNVPQLNVVKSPKTGKLFVSDDAETFVLRCEQTINLKKEVVYIYKEAISDGCLINKKASKNVIGIIK